MSFRRKVKRVHVMARRRDRKRIQKDLAKKARERAAEKQSAVNTSGRGDTGLPKLKARMADGALVIEATDASPESAATL